MPPEEPAPAPGLPAPAAEGARQADEEARAWSAVVASWEDAAAHRDYLARFADLDGLALAGRRYREALAARPGDPVALRFRDEVVKRAAVQGLALLPRAAPPPTLHPWVKRVLLTLLSGLVAALAWKLFALLGRSPEP